MNPTKTDWYLEAMGVVVAVWHHMARVLPPTHRQHLSKSIAVKMPSSMLSKIFYFISRNILFFYQTMTQTNANSFHTMSKLIQNTLQVKLLCIEEGLSYKHMLTARLPDEQWPISIFSPRIPQINTFVPTGDFQLI